MSEEERRHERHKVLDEYLRVKADAEALRSRRRRTGEAFRDLGQLFLVGQPPANEVDWELVAGADELKRLLKEADEAIDRERNLRLELRQLGVPVAD